MSRHQQQNTRHKNNNKNFKSVKGEKPTHRQASKPTSRPAGKGPLFPRHLRPVLGQHAIAELLKVRPRSIELAWIDKNSDFSREKNELFKRLQDLGVKTEIFPSAHLEKISQSHQGIVLFANERPEVDWEKLYSKQKSIILLLDGVEDVHNLGAVLRTAWLMGVDAVLTPEVGSARLTGAVHKIACGGVEHVPLVELNQFATTIEDLKKNDYWVFGLSHTGEKTLLELNLPSKIVFCLGAEDKGLRKTTERLCDELVSIPQVSAEASYNVSVATGMVLLEAGRQINL